MSNSSPSAPKKGISGFAIAGIGCGGLVLLAAIGGFMLAGKACSRFSEVTKEMQDNPAKAAALIAVKLNPDLEVVTTNDAKHEITIKNRKDGKTVTMSFEDITKGKFKMTDDSGKTISVDGSKAASGGGIQFEDINDKSVIGAPVDFSSLPPWIPAYPGLRQVPGSVTTDTNGKRRGTIKAETTDPLHKVKYFYDAKLRTTGFQVNTDSAANAGKQSATVAGKKEDDGKIVILRVKEGNGVTQLELEYSEP